MTEKPESVAPFSERFSESNPSSAARLKPLDIESEAFKAWFGGSKIVDGDGKPLRVFHGGVAGINVFGANAEETIEWAKRNNFKLSDIEQQHLEKPVWFFTDNEQVAYGYADQYEQERQAVYPVYLKMKNPLDLRPDVVGGETALKRLRDVFGYDLTDQAEKDTYLIKRQISVHVRQVHGKMKDTLSGLGYDGLIFPDTDVYDKGQHTAYVVFTPTSIKSATENTGEFSMDNPDIRFRMKPTVEPGPVNTESEAFKKWFGQSRVVDGDGKPLRVYHGTGSVFDEFKPLSRSPDFGFHFGTVGQANHFAQKAGIGGNVMPVYLSIKNPLRMRDVFSRGLEGVDSISSELVRLGIITREDRLEILEMRPLRKAMARIREAVLAAGHDGIVYENQHEGVIPADKINELPQEYQVEINDAFAKGWIGESKKWVVRKKGDDFPYGMGPTKEIAVKNALKRLNTKDFRGTNGRKFDSYIAFHPFQIKSAFSNTGEFSPDSPDIKYRLVPPRLSDGGLPPKILGPMIDAATKGWRYRPDIVVVADQNQLPLGVRMAIPPGNIVKGVCYQGAVFLVRSNLDGYRDALDTLFHEAFGHYGLRLMGEAAKPFLRDLYAAKAPEIKEIAKKYNLDVGKSRDRLAAAEEWLAREAASRPKSVWVDRAVKTVAGWLRSIGVKLKPSDREVRAWLADMRLAVVEKGAADKNTAKRILRAREARFMTVYHGTRHVWPPEPGFPHGRPRLDKVKTGEGGNAYGHGWYSAQAEEVARAYESAGDAFRIDGMSVEDFIAAKPPVTDLFEAARYLKTDVITASKWLAENEAMIERRVAGYIQTYGENAEFMIRSAVSRSKPLDAELAKIREMFASGRIGASANIYKLDIPDDVIPSLLDWDKPLSEQSQDVRLKLEPLLSRLLKNAEHEKPESRTLPDVVKRIKDGAATGEAIYNWAGFPPEKASEYLASLGIPGCKYADQNSRKIHMAPGNNLRWNVSTSKGVFPFDTEAEAGEFAEQQRTYNFVIWDQEVLDRVALLERNGERLDAIRAAQNRQGEEERAMFLFGGPKGASPSGVAHLADAKRMWNAHDCLRKDLRRLDAPEVVEEAADASGLKYRLVLGGRYEGRFSTIAAAKRHLDALRRRVLRLEASMQGNIREEIWRKTGWWEIVPGSGEWKFEIDDSEAALTPPKGVRDLRDRLCFNKEGLVISGPYAKYRKALAGWLKDLAGEPLGSILKHDKLFEAYPDLKQIPVEFDPEAEGARFTVVPGPMGGECIAIGPDVLKQARPEHVLLHEIQHVVQKRENFATGGSPNIIMAEDALQGDERLERFKRRLDDLSFAGFDWDSNEIKAVRSERGKYAESALMDKFGANAGLEYYKRLTGEAEARLAQYRFEMTPEQRRTEPPWISLGKMMRREGLLENDQSPEDVLISRHAAAFMSAIPPEQVLQTPQFHATSSTAAGESILRDGEVKVPDLAGRKGFLKPREGRTYFTSDKQYAAIYALGGWMMEREPWWKDFDKKAGLRAGRYGYVFQIDPRSIKDIDPDEDSIGLILSSLLQGEKRGGRPSSELLDWLERLARTHVAPSRLHRVEEGDAGYQASVGKQLVGKMTDAQKLDLIVNHGAHMSNRGNLKILRAWRVDKARSAEIKSDGSNLLQIGEQVFGPPMAKVENRAASTEQKPTEIEQVEDIFVIPAGVTQTPKRSPVFKRSEGRLCPAL